MQHLLTSGEGSRSISKPSSNTSTGPSSNLSFDLERKSGGIYVKEQLFLIGIRSTAFKHNRSSDISLSITKTQIKTFSIRLMCFKQQYPNKLVQI